MEIMLKPKSLRRIRNTAYHVYFRCVQQEISEELINMMHGRRHKERRDSVTQEMLLERFEHQKKFDEIVASDELIKFLEKNKLSGKSRKNQVYRKLPINSPLVEERLTLTAAGGYGIHLTSASENWPIFDHLLPEIAVAGHSNSGKSTLVNAMVGVAPRKGPASVHDRAGWTDQLCFYKLGKKPPVMTLVDFPGYGHAVADARDKRAWSEMIRDYLASRDILSLCGVLVDCTRGLCAQDKKFLKTLHQLGVPRLVVVTKTDLLDTDQLAKSLTIIADDLQSLPAAPPRLPRTASSTDSSPQSSLRGPIPFPGFEEIVPVSCATGAGVQTLWRTLLSVVERTVRSSDLSRSTSVGDENSNQISSRVGITDGVTTGGRDGEKSVALFHARPTSAAAGRSSSAVREHFLAEEFRRKVGTSPMGSQPSTSRPRRRRGSSLRISRGIVRQRKHDAVE